MKSKVTFNKSGKGYYSAKINIPKAYLELMKITKEDNKIDITYNDEKLIIKKVKENG